MVNGQCNSVNKETTDVKRCQDPINYQHGKIKYPSMWSRLVYLQRGRGDQYSTP